MKLNPWYVSGLVDGEGCFCITLAKHRTNKSRLDPRLMFEIEMIIDEQPLLEALRSLFGCGHIYILNYERYGWRPHVKYAVKNYRDITEKIIPFFKTYPLMGKKRKDFVLFCQASEIFDKGGHKTERGIKKLRDIQSRMNLRRKLKLASARTRENRVSSGRDGV